MRGVDQAAVVSGPRLYFESRGVRGQGASEEPPRAAEWLEGKQALG